MQPRVIRTIVPLALLLAVQPLAAQDDAPLGSVAALTPVGARRVARLLVATPADTDTTSRAVPHDGVRSDTTGHLRTVYSPGERFAMRSVVGTLGWIGGAYIGAYAVARFSGNDCRSSCAGYDALLTGMVTGGILGTTLVVSATGYGDRCAGGTRAVLAALGAAVGTGAGIFLGFNEHAPVHPFIAIPLSAGIGGAAGAALCTAEGPARQRR